MTSCNNNNNNNKCYSESHGWVTLSLHVLPWVLDTSQKLSRGPRVLCVLRVLQTWLPWKLKGWTKFYLHLQRSRRGSIPWDAEGPIDRKRASWMPGKQKQAVLLQPASQLASQTKIITPVCLETAYSKGLLQNQPLRLLRPPSPNEGHHHHPSARARSMASFRCRWHRLMNEGL